MACLLSVIATLGVGAVEGHRSKARVHDLALATRQRDRLRRVQDENRRLREQELTAEERDRLQAMHDEAEALRARINALKASLQASGGNGTLGPTLSADWVYAGRATPRASFESVLWTASRGDVDQLASLLDFDGEARGAAEAIFGNLPPDSRSEYPSAQKVVATLLSASFPKDASAMTPVGARVDGHDALLSFRVDHADGTSRTNVYHFRQETDGWRLLVPASVMADYEKMLAGDGRAPQVARP
jgi:hypothetical protein